MFSLDELANLSELDLSIANYIMKNTEQVAYMRIRELASHTHVSPSTIMRFTKRMGFDSFPEMRLYIRQHLTDSDKLTSTEAYTEKFIQNESFTPEFDNSLKQLSCEIKHAPLIHCIGMGASGAMAEYACKHLTTLGYYSFATKGVYFPYAILKESPVTRADEICILFSVSGNTSELVQMQQALKESHIKTACITSNSDSFLAKNYDLTITYDTSYDRIHYNADLSSQLPVVFIIETLIRLLITEQS